MCPNLHGIDRIRAVQLGRDIPLGQELLVLGLEETIAVVLSVLRYPDFAPRKNMETHPAGVSASTKRPILAGDWRIRPQF